MNGEDIRATMDEIVPEDLPSQWQELAGSLGLVNLLQLCKLYGGTSLYIPKYDNLIAPAKRRASSLTDAIIRSSRGGSNYPSAACMRSPRN